MGDRWHPILQAREYQPGRWVMEDTLGRPYALIDIIRRGDEVGYKVTAWKQDAGPVLGYFTNLAASAAHAHERWINRGVPSGSANHTGNWPGKSDPWADAVDEPRG